MKKLIVLVLLASLTFFSCNKGNNISPEQMDEFNKGITNPKALEIVESNNEFAFDIFKTINENESKENFMISPVSLSIALSMIYNGSDGDTKTAFEEVLKYNATGQEINEFNKNLIGKLSSDLDGSIMEIANSIWMDNNFPVKPEFIQTNQEYFDAEVQNLDFANPNSVNIINDWVSDKTHDKIPTILDEISAEAVMYLINALYFNANWNYKFDKDDTEVETFHTNNGNKDVDMMNLTSKLLYTSNDLFSSIELPYEKNKFSMIIMLPNEDKTTDDIIDQLDSDNWNNWIESMDSTKLAVKLPKFKLDYENELRDELAELGLEIAFSRQADFSKLSDLSTFISLVLQKTFIDVNEKGTEAAAVTIIGIELTSAPGGPKLFEANRPFIYAIKENLSGSICFIGKVGSPEYED